MLTFSFSGPVYHINDHADPFLDSSVVLGAQLSGSFVFDETVSDQNPDTQVGSYSQAVSSGASFTLAVGNYNLDLLTGRYYIRVENNLGDSNNHDKFAVRSGSSKGTFDNGVDSYSCYYGINLRDFNSGQVFANTDLPTSLTLGDFNDGGNTHITVLRPGLVTTDIYSKITVLTAPVV